MHVTAGADETRALPLRVLIAEDNEEAADSLALLLEVWGHEVRVARDGLAALDAARTFRPEALLLDLTLPRLDGFGVARGVRQQDELRGTAVVALTGHADEESRRRALDAGCDHFLVKPVDPAEIRAVLGRLRPAP